MVKKQKQKPLILQSRGGMKAYIYKDGQIKLESPVSGRMPHTKFRNRASAIKYAKREGFTQIVKK